MRAGLVQLNVTDDVDVNIPVTVAHVRAAVAGGAGFVLTPEVTGLLTADKLRQRALIVPEDQDRTLAALRDEAARAGIWLLIGSLGIKVRDEADGRFANRSFLIGPDGGIVARYDKIHMFDVNVSDTEVFRESAEYRPGAQAVVAATPFGKIGLSVCYDLRFPHLYRRLAQGGAEILTIPAAFNHITGQAHWEVLLRARAIESGAWVLAPAQTGQHIQDSAPGKRRTHGHSMVVAPWGEVVSDAGAEPGVTFAEIDLDQVARARHRVPSLSHDRPFDGP
ncbi:carbon-nitrogen hydrolase family protein [Gemmobacter sp.]|uniref:carbon-nitrogen hydrolase family protein n=1 Tax=Gemmobacter sp. TaxID=1898957 RepID=UPI002AFF2434|nr:carbon-nitrogen hydrolase family protein [Gemmobacter sp.]